MNIPYTVEERPDTGLANGKLGIWLFLASEVMLFGALFSSYIILRNGAVEWPMGSLSVPLGAANTVLLIFSSVTMVMAWASLKLNDFNKHRWYLIFTFGLASWFLVNKYFEYSAHLRHGEGPRHSTFDAIYFTLTGLHGLHILGGMIVMAYFIGPGARLWKKNPEQFTNRIEYTGLYWHFVDLVWIFLFPILYLLSRRVMHTDTAAVKKSIRTYLMIGAALLVFTGITVAANLVHLPVHLAITVALIIASIKATMVALVFMHLSHEKQLIYGSLTLTAVFFVVLMLVPSFTGMDTIGTHVHTKHAAPAAGHEGGH